MDLPITKNTNASEIKDKWLEPDPHVTPELIFLKSHEYSKVTDPTICAKAILNENLIFLQY